MLLFNSQQKQSRFIGEAFFLNWNVMDIQVALMKNVFFNKAKKNFSKKSSKNK